MPVLRPDLRSRRPLHRPWLLAAAAVAVSSACALLILGDAPRTQAAPTAVAPPAASAPAPSVDPGNAFGPLRRELDELRALVAELGRGGPDATSLDDDATSDDLAARAPADIRKAADDRAHRRMALFADALAAEPDDPTWSGQAAQRLHTSFVERLPSDATLDDVSCRSSLCRIVVRFASVQAFELGVEHLPMLVPWDTRGFMHPDERDPTRAVIYVGREIAAVPQ